MTGVLDRTGVLRETGVLRGTGVLRRTGVLRGTGMLRRTGVLAVVLAIPQMGCATCSGSADETAGSTGPTGAAGSTGPTGAPGPLPAKTPPVSPWTLGTVRGPQGVAATQGCRQRAPVLRAKVPRETHFLADGRAPGVVVVADTRLDPPEVLRSGELTLTAQATPPPSGWAGTGTPGGWVPWPHARSAPRLARTGDRWIAAWETPSAEGPSEVFLHRGRAAESLGVGDAFVAADLACAGPKCALLTSRIGRVAPAGALVWRFDPTAGSPSTPPPVEIEPGGDSTARPFGLASIDGPRGPLAVLFDGKEAVFWTTEGDGAPAVLARLPAENGLLDALWLGDKPLLLAHGNVVDEQGCAREGADAAGAKLRIAREATPPVDVRTPGAPTLLTLRPLTTGALATWVSPLGCAAERHVVFGLLLDEKGAPAGSPMPIADGETFTLSSTANDVDLLIRQADEVSWVRLTCEPR